MGRGSTAYCPSCLEVGARLRRVRRLTVFIESDNLARLIVPCLANGRDAVAPLPSGLQPSLPTGQLVNRPANPQSTFALLHCLDLPLPLPPCPHASLPPGNHPCPSSLPVSLPGPISLRWLELGARRLLAS